MQAPEVPPLLGGTCRDFPQPRQGATFGRGKRSRVGGNVPSPALRVRGAVRYTRSMSPPPTPPLQHGGQCVYKSSTARALFQGFPRLRQALWGGAFWSGGYSVSTVGQRGGYEAIKRYVQSPGQTPEAAGP